MSRAALDCASQDARAAYKVFETILWPDGAVCPHCGADASSVRTRRGWWRCSGCRKQFTILTGTPFQSSHLPLHKWLQAIQLIGSDRLFSDLTRVPMTPKTALSVARKLRKAVADGDEVVARLKIGLDKYGPKNTTAEQLGLPERIKRPARRRGL